MLIHYGGVRSSLATRPIICTIKFEPAKEVATEAEAEADADNGLDFWRSTHSSLSSTTPEYPLKELGGP